MIVNFVIGSGDLLNFGESGDPVETRFGATFIVSALAIEVLAAALGTTRITRVALASGVAVGTVGLAGEWAWNQRAYQPWDAAMLPEAVILGTIAGVGAAVLGAIFSHAVARERGRRNPRGAVVAVSALACLVVILLPMRRLTGDVEATVRVESVADDGTARVVATLDPVDAA